MPGEQLFVAEHRSRVPLHRRTDSSEFLSSSSSLRYSRVRDSTPLNERGNGANSLSLSPSRRWRRLEERKRALLLVEWLGFINSRERRSDDGNGDARSSRPGYRVAFPRNIRSFFSSPSLSPLPPPPPFSLTYTPVIKHEIRATA